MTLEAVPKGSTGGERICTMSKVFLDTNVLAYASDSDAPVKQRVARDLLRELASDVPPCISTQVLQEFYVTATRKLDIAPLKAKRILQTFTGMETVTICLDDVHRAIDGSILWQLSFWDALIIVAARKACCTVLYTEDLNDGQVIEGVEIRNPFAE